MELMAAPEELRDRISALDAEERQSLDDLLEGNGLTEEQIISKNDEITDIEMFLFNFPRMMCFDLFPHLRSLTLTQQGLTKIENLKSLVSLDSLWLNENCIEVIEGLEHCPNLRKLYMWSNRIRRIENLDCCKELEVLWLADNQLVVLEGLSNLSKLRELNLARNLIDQIGDSLAPNTALEDLNLADNQIGAFKEVCYLARLPKLLALCFTDPHWGDCPLASLCNYQTYVMFNLPNLKTLDTLPLPEETKQLAEATFMKKKMYYNMRIKTLKRNTSNAIRKANQGRASKAGTAVAMFNLLLRQLKDIEGELQAVQEYDHYQPPGTYISALKEKADRVKQVVGAKTVAIRAAWAQFEDCKSRVHELSNDYVRRMMVELETGGNIRMEDGKPSDLWYSSCVDLVNSRFFPADFAALGIRGLKVTRVTRIHNRFLRNRFEERLESLVDMSDSNYKRSLEYLFFGDNPALPGELLRAAEDGFRHPSEYSALGLDGAVSLSNSVSVVDMPRLEAATSGQRAGGRNPLVGQVLVAKVFLGKCAQESALPAGTQPRPGKPGQMISKGDYPECNSVFRVKQGDQKQRMWYVFEHTLVLPEYLVEYEYEASPTGKLGSLSNSAALTTEGQAALDGLDFDVRLIARPLVPLLLEADRAELDDRGQPVVHLTGKEKGMEVFNLEPQLPEREMINIISEEAILKLARASSMATLTYLNLHGSGIRKLDGLHSLPALRVLLLSFNEILKIECLSELTALERLDLSFNSIRRIEGLKGLTALKDLELSNNLLHRLEDVNMLKKYVPDLASLDLSNNPICTHKTYRTLLLRRLPGLHSLDREAIQKEDREAAGDNTSTLTVQVIKENSFSRRSTSIAVSGMSAANNDPEDESWWKSVEELIVEHQRVRRLQNLDKLSSLRRASFADNELTRLEGLDNLRTLEELSVEDNRIMSIDGISRCTSLKKLELGKNKICRMENLEMLTGLTQLSVEDNEIESLVGISTLSCLMELYIGNNQITQLREILTIKDLPKLIIVDLLGNPLCRENDYRLYTVYHLKKLKVLDGAGIEAGEQTAAKNKYAGRLTIDTLEAKVGHHHFDRLRELDITGLRIRDVASCFQMPDFSGIQEINMDNNMMMDVQGFAHLPYLSVLRLGANRIGDGCRFDTNPFNSNPPFPSLQVLQLGQNAIASIERLGLSKLCALRSLFLQGNEITRIDGLEGLRSLQELVLDRNRIKYVDAASFAPVQNLRELRLEENGLRSLQNLNVLSSLQALHLGFNRIGDTSEIDRLAGMTELMEITLVNNPVVRKQVYRAVLLGKVPSLRAIDGREVTAEERDYVNSMFAPQAPPTMDAINQMGILMAGGGQQGATKMPIKMTALNFEQQAGAGFGPGTAVRDDYGSPLGLDVQGGSIAVMGQRTRPSSNDRQAPSPGYVLGGRGVGGSGATGRGNGRNIGGLGTRRTGYSSGSRR